MGPPPPPSSSSVPPPTPMGPLLHAQHNEAISPTVAPWKVPGIAAAPAAHASRALPEVALPAPRFPDAATPVAPAYKPAVKRIASPEDLAHFLQSDAVQEYLAFVLALGEAVTGKKLSNPCPASDTCAALCGLLAKLSAWVDEIPPVQQSLRYGNPAYRTWHARLSAAAPELLRAVLPEGMAQAATELAPYLADSFGNATRIDYGTGHETNFCALLFCLAKLGAVGPGDRQALVTRVFRDYLNLMRKVQVTYWLEPAGAHGVGGATLCACVRVTLLLHLLTFLLLLLLHWLLLLLLLRCHSLLLPSQAATACGGLMTISSCPSSGAPPSWWVTP